MPVYVYHCDRCKEDTEVLEKSNPYRDGGRAAATVACDHCGAVARRQIVCNIAVERDWTPRFIENMAPTPVWCASRSDYKRELKKRGLRQKEKGE